MVPHAGQRPEGQASAVTTSGLKRKSPTAKGKGVASADPGRLRGKATESRKPQPTNQGQSGARGKGGAGEAKRGKAVLDGKDEGFGKGKGEGKGEGKAKGKGKGKGKGKSDIDDIFAGVKRLKQQRAEEEAERVAKKKKIKEEHKRRQANPFTGEGGPDKRWAWADEVKPVRFDEDGLPIYTWESLRIGQGGGTALCPFDCDCCF